MHNARGEKMLACYDEPVAVVIEFWKMSTSQQDSLRAERNDSACVGEKSTSWSFSFVYAQSLGDRKTYSIREELLQSLAEDRPRPALDGHTTCRMGRVIFLLRMEQKVKN